MAMVLLTFANSEVANRGYKDGKRSGLAYATGTGSIIKNNRIHDFWDGIFLMAI